MGNLFKRLALDRFSSSLASLGKRRIMGDTVQNKPVEIAVFDFDGTSISGNSPVILVRYLRRIGLLKKSIFTRIIFWALRYKLRLPQNESWVRGAVFSAFKGEKKEDVDRFLGKFYDEHLEKLFRTKADEAIAYHLSCGREVWVVSATFEPLIQQAMKSHGFTKQFSTRMATDGNGCYTCKVEGLPVEGEEKLARVTEYANKEYGEGNWVITHAYGDHHSDRTMLRAAQNSYAVTPDRPLRRTAKENGWDILSW